MQEKLKNDEIQISVIIVNWQVKEYLKKCLLSIKKIYGDTQNFLKNSVCPLEVIVIDNASTDGSVSMIRDTFSWVKLIVNLSNRGFATANNQGIKISKGKYILFLNPDTEITENSFHIMMNFLKDHKNVGAVGCRIIYPNGALQPSCRRFPTVELAFWEQNHDFFLRDPEKVSNDYFMKDMDYSMMQEVDQPMGAGLMVKKEALDDVGGFDDKYFMFFDEVDLCYRIKQKGWKIMYFPQVTIIHHRAKSVDFAFEKGWSMDKEFHKSMFRFLWKHYPTRFLKIILLKLIYYYNKLMRIPARIL